MREELRRIARHAVDVRSARRFKTAKSFRISGLPVHAGRLINKLAATVR
jgi:hypothetical protein